MSVKNLYHFIFMRTTEEISISKFATNTDFQPYHGGTDSMYTQEFIKQQNPQHTTQILRAIQAAAHLAEIRDDEVTLIELAEPWITHEDHAQALEED